MAGSSSTITITQNFLEKADSRMTWSEWIQNGTASLAIIGAILSGGIYLKNSRDSAISAMTRSMALTWTNEGDILSTETNFIDMPLKLDHGDLYGTLTSPQTDDVFEVHIEPGWFSAQCELSLLRGRSLIPIATAKLTFNGKMNRLHWIITSKNAPPFLPNDTILWPSVIQN